MNSRKTRPRPIVLAVLDGFAERDEDGFLGLGAGRAALADRSRIDEAIQNGRFPQNDVIRRLVGQATGLGGRLHLIGLVSEAGAHSSLHHLSALIDVAKKARVRVVVHALLDARDVPPRTAPRTVAELESKLAGGVGRIGTVGGRFWAMDSENHGNRVEKCYRAILAAEVRRADSALRGIEESYDAGKTDEIVEPFVVFDYPGVSPVDVALHVHFRHEGSRALTHALASPRFDGFPRKGGRAPFAGRYACLTACDDSLDVPVAWRKEPRPNLFPELLARAGYRQFRCADAAHYAGVTRFFNGGREEPFEGEVDAQVSSAGDVVRVAEDAIRSGQYDFVLVHFQNRQVVGNTGIADAPIHAVDADDAGLGKLVEAARSVRGAVVVVGHPGRGERSKAPLIGSPQATDPSSHVPLLYVNDADPSVRVREGGRLCDVAPTLLELLDLPRPTEMTGRSLLHR
jgi:2,3-bisphosphoglycerate-independent phosphoglycerate mutase